MTIKTYMAIMAERDAAIRERNMALDERKRFLAERDMAMLQRDAALVERNSALEERNEALAALRQRSSSANENNPTRPDLSGPETVQVAKRIHNDHQMNHMFDYDPAEAEYNQRDDNDDDNDDDFNVNGAPAKTSKPGKVKLKEKKDTLTEGSSKQVSTGTSNGWDHVDLFGEEENSLGFNEVNFEEPTMPVPVCSCSGVPQPCYKWGNGGWQSACCTSSKQTDLLAHGSNKRGSRGGGRKMSGTVFNKLLNRLVDEGHDLFTPLDLKNHWAKHGTKRHGSSK